MANIRWTPDMSVGIESLDSDHQKLLALINQLDDAIEQRKGQQQIGDVLTELINYTLYHFAREEALMDACKYPDAETHAHAHEVLRLQVTHIRDRFVSNPDSIHDREVLSFLKNWLTSHILGRDKLYAPFMTADEEAVAKADRAFVDTTRTQSVEA